MCFCLGEVVMKRQILRLEVKSGLNVNYPDIKTAILTEVSRFSTDNNPSQHKLLITSPKGSVNVCKMYLCTTKYLTTATLN